MIRRIKTFLFLLLTVPGFFVLALVSMSKSAISSLEEETIEFLQKYSEDTSINIPQEALGDLGFKIIYYLYNINMYSMIITAVSIVWVLFFFYLSINEMKKKNS